MLKTQDLHAYYGPIEALKGIDITVKEGQIACLIGSNGAGKTTLLKDVYKRQIFNLRLLVFRWACCMP